MPKGTGSWHIRGRNCQIIYYRYGLNYDEVILTTTETTETMGVALAISLDVIGTECEKVERSSIRGPEIGFFC